MFSSDSLRAAARLVNGALLLGGLAAVSVGCGSDSSNPTAISVDELKAPGSLWIQDNGNGAATLYWTGSNNESDFDGYNVYGMNRAKLTNFGQTYKEGDAIELLDDKNEPVEAARNFLGQFNYNPDKPFEEKGVTDSKDEEAKFSALPVFKKGADGEGIFPTCGVDGSVCKNHETAFPRQTVKENSARCVNGEVSYPISGLTVGQEYCFFVLSSMDKGSKVSMTSTNIACVTPRYKSEFSLTIPAAHAGKKIIDFYSLLTACKASAGCAAGDTASIKDAGLNRDANAQDPGPLYLEHVSSGGGSFAAGTNVAIRDMGFYAEGFNDPKLPRIAPALKLGTDLGADQGPLINTGGYTPAGRSRTLLKNHVYVVAVPEKDATSPQSFYYHWIWVIGDVTANSATNVEMRLSHSIDQR